MTDRDLADGLRLSGLAGWNQTPADWSRFLALEPAGCFVAEREGRAVGTVTTCRFGPVAWVAMMLVEPDLRGRGIGRALMGHALAFLDGSGARTVRLDATPLGRPLYESLGFAGDYELTRFQGRPSGGPETPREAGPGVARLDPVVALDREVTGTDRGKLLRRLAGEFPASFRVAEDGGAVAGYVTGRPGVNAYQVGPCVAVGGAGASLLAGALSGRAGGDVLVDVPRDNPAAEALVAARGLTPRRPFLRMTRGVKIGERAGDLWASSGPEMG